ncbi:MAG: N-6 DNA methylase [Clostridia bacterium]
MYSKNNFGDILKKFLTTNDNKTREDISKRKKANTKNTNEIKVEPNIKVSETKSKPTKKEKTNKEYDASKEFMKKFKQLTYNHNSLDVWRDFIIMFACSIANACDKTYFDEREKMYLDIINKYKKEEQAIFPELCANVVMSLDDNLEQDFLGKIYMDLGLGNQNRGQFFTPYHLCQFMAGVTCMDSISKAKNQGVITIHDSCCGAGATLIAGVNEVKKELEKENMNFQNHLLVTGQDVDMTVALMCYIQISLLGVAGYVKVGNSLTEPMCVNDDKRNYWYTPIYFSDIWTMRRIFKNLM